MADTATLENKISSQEADYLKRLEGAGQLPTVISDAWAKAGGADTTKLRGEEANLLKNYVSAGAEARQKYSDVWDPFARDTLASKQVALNYAPIADIRNELAMRAQALGVATQSATAMYNTGTKIAETGLGFTENAYSRAAAKEAAATAEANRLQEHDWTVQENDKARAAAAAKSTASAKDDQSKLYGGAYNFMTNYFDANKDQKDTQWFTENDAKKALIDKYGSTLSKEDLDAILYTARKDTWGT